MSIKIPQHLSRFYRSNASISGGHVAFTFSFTFSFWIIAGNPRCQFTKGYLIQHFALRASFLLWSVTPSALFNRYMIRTFIHEADWRTLFPVAASQSERLNWADATSVLAGNNPILECSGIGLKTPFCKILQPITSHFLSSFSLKSWRICLQNQILFSWLVSSALPNLCVVWLNKAVKKEL